MRKIIRKSLLPVFLAATMWSCNTAEEEMENYVLSGDPLPEFTVYDTDGNEVTNADIEGKRCYLYFFSTECSACVNTMNLVDDAWKSLKDSHPDAVVLAINRDEGRGKIESLWAAKDLSMPYYTDPGRVTFNKFANRGVPRSYVVGADGIVEKMFEGRPRHKDGFYYTAELVELIAKGVEK